MSATLLNRPPKSPPRLRFLYGSLFDPISVPAQWVDQVKQLEKRGRVVFVLRNLNPVDLLALDHLTQHHGLSTLGFTNRLSLGPLDPTDPRWWPGTWRRPEQDYARLRQALVSGQSAALFLKRPPQLTDIVAGATGGRGLVEGDDLLRCLIRLQPLLDRPVYLLPQVFVWTNRPDTQGASNLDLLLGPREWPSTLRTIAQFVSNYRHVELRAGQPLDLADHLKDHPNTPEQTHVRRIVYMLLRRLERERRAVTGPARVPPDLQRQRVLRSPQLRRVVKRLAGEKPVDRLALTHQADQILRNLQALPNSAGIRAAGVCLDHLFGRMYAGIDVDISGIEQLRECGKEGTLVLLPSHRSHIDSLVLSYIFHHHRLGMPLIAAGDNLAFFPVGAIARRLGAFFIRRSFKGDRLYAATVEAYVRRLLRDGNTIELFVEGGRSRTGKLLQPQLGLLSILANAALSMDRKQVFFAPISIGYERVVEGQAFQDEVTGRDKVKEDAAGLLRSTGVLASRYGRINVQFGKPLLLSEVCHELQPDGGLSDLSPARRRAMVTRLANRTMDEINRVTEVTPGALTALAMLSSELRALSHEDLVERSRHLLLVLQEQNARISRHLLERDTLRLDAITEAAQLFVEVGLVEAVAPEDAHSTPRNAGAGLLYRVPEHKRLQLDSAKNHIVHFFVERGIAATAALVSSLPERLQLGRERVADLSALFKYEFRFRADRPASATFDDVLNSMVHAGTLSIRAGEVDLGPGRAGWSAMTYLATYRAILRNFLEGYRVAARSLTFLLKGPLPEKELLRRATVLGERMFLSNDIMLREAISRPMYANALLAFRDEGYVMLQGGKLALSPSWAAADAVRTVESRVACYLT